MDFKKALTLTLSHPMGEGTAIGRSSFCHGPQSNHRARIAGSVANGSPSPIGWEGRGEGTFTAKRHRNKLCADESRANVDAETLAQMRRMAALHKRVALLELMKHEFLDTKSGTTVTVDWGARTAEIKPQLDQ